MTDREKKRSVLIVDDEPKVLRFMEIDLKLRGFQVVTTTSGTEALQLVRSVRPDIMLLDIVMPETDGFDVLRQLRTFDQTPVIVFSAGSDNRDKAIKLGANDFVTKPFKTDEIVGKINSQLIE